MFDEVVVRVELGCKVLAGQLVVGRFGRDRADSVVAISQTLDKLIVHDPSSLSNALDVSTADSAPEASNNAVNGLPMAANSPTSGQLASVYYVSVRDVIKTVSVKSFAISSPAANQANRTRLGNPEEKGAEPSYLGGSSNLSEQQQQQFRNSSSSESAQVAAASASANNRLNSNRLAAPKDLLLIGCSNSVLVYDAFSQSSLLSLDTPTQVNAISSESSTHCPFSWSCQQQESATTVFGGPQRLYTVRFEPEHLAENARNVHAEISSERSTGDTISCLAQGRLGPMELVLTGSLEHKIRAYQLDSFEQNIQACQLTLDEGAKVNCLCPINTQVAASSHNSGNRAAAGASLPSVVGDHFAQAASPEWAQAEQMNYFAFGLESGFIGVYRLFLQHRNLHLQPAGAGADAAAADSTETVARAERLWRLKCKQTPTTILMYDINGDGFDELIVGFKSGRLEARAPFTGQLLAVSRCFKSSSERLAGLVALDYQRVGVGRQVLLACSTSGSLVGFKPRFCQPRIPLQGYLLGFGAEQAKQADLQPDWPTAANLLYNSALAHHANSSSSQTATLLKTIEEEQERTDVFSVKHSSASDTQRDGSASSSSTGGASADLHIESKTDDTKPAKCDARQNLELLQRINALQANQMELERRACNIYHLNVSQASKFYPSDVGIAHKWSFDSVAVCLRLSILVSTGAEYVRLVELEDASRNFLANGHLLASPAQSSCAEQDCDQSEPHLHQSAGASHLNEQIASRPPKSHVIVVPLRSLRNQESRLELKVFCESFRKTPDSASPIRVARVYGKQIDVPKFAMFTASPSQAATGAGATSARNSSKQATATAPDSGDKLIRVTFRLKECSKVKLLEWLHESFLCFQFKRSLDQESVGAQACGGGCDSFPAGEHHQERRSSARSVMMMIMDDKSEKFELNLMDIRHTLAKMAKHEAAAAAMTSTPNDAESSTANEARGEQVLSRFCSRVRIAHSLAGTLTVECESADLIVELARSLALIDRWQLDSNSLASSLSAAADKQLAAIAGDDFVVGAEVGPILRQLETLAGSAKQLEDSERRIQTELYESADYTSNLLQQLGIANDLNEFTTAKELLSELFMMLNGAQNAARAHCLNSRSRGELLKRIGELKEKVSFLTGQSEGCR